MTTIPINAVGQKENLSPVPRFDENRFPMIPRRPLNIKSPIKCKDNSNLDSLPGCTHRIASRIERHTSVDGGAALWLRNDCEYVGAIHVR